MQAEAIIQRAFLPNFKIQIPLIFLASFAYFTFLSAVDISWVHGDHDVGDTVWATHVWGLAHPQGAPLYVTLGYFLTGWQEDIAHRAQTLAVFLSALPSAIIACILYAKTKNLIAPVLFCASMIVVAQSTVPKYYPLVSLLILLQWLNKDSSKAFSVWSFFGLILHHLNVFAWFYLLVYRATHKLSWKKELLIMLPAAAVYYGYWAFSERPPSEVGWSESTFRGYLGGQGFLLMGLSVLYPGEVWRRLQDVFWIGLPSIGMGLLMLPFLKDRWLLGLAGIFSVHYALNLDPHTYTYLMPAMTLLFLGLGQLQWPAYPKKAALVVSAVLIVWNGLMMDIGRTLDPEPTAARHFLEELKTIPKESTIYVGDAGWFDLTGFLLEENAPHTILRADVAAKPQPIDYCISDVGTVGTRPELIAWADCPPITEHRVRP